MKTNSYSRWIALAAMLLGSALWHAAIDASTAQAARRALQNGAQASDSTSSAITDFLAADAIPAEKVCCLPIHYRALACNRCFCGDSIKIDLLVEDPACCGCYAKVPVCLPVCCAGDPHVCGKCTVLGRRRVSYTWECGFTVEVIFRTRGDLVVLY